MTVLAQQRSIEAELGPSGRQLLGKSTVAEDLHRRISWQRLGCDEHEKRNAKENENAEKDSAERPPQRCVASRSFSGGYGPRRPEQGLRGGDRRASRVHHTGRPSS